MKRKQDMPILVYIGLVGINSRSLALFFVWLCLLLAAAATMFGAVLLTDALPALADATPPMKDLARYIGLLSVVSTPVLLACAWWYWYALRWVDTHASWN